MGNILSVKDLSVKIGQRVLIRNVFFDVNEGDVVLLSGANGIGKSTILKGIMRLETAGKKIEGEIVKKGFGNILDLGEVELQRYRSKIAYVQQRDEYSEMGNIQVKDIISESAEACTGRALSYAEVNELIDEWIPRRDDNSRVFEAKSKPAKFSGGEQRLLSVLSIVATRSRSDLLIIDEPLNNLDFVNARNISNLLNKVIRENPKMGILMVSHCRIFPFINREIKLSAEGMTVSPESYVCHSCFGDPNEDGFY